MKKFNCPLGIPVGIGLLKMGLIGIIINIIDLNLFNLGVSLTLFLLGGPFIRIIKELTKLSHKLVELERKLE
ncbi:MAG: hypothetical protein QM478_10115 [Flavobacteriaceae bacterium]